MRTVRSPGVAAAHVAGWGADDPTAAGELAAALEGSAAGVAGIASQPLPETAPPDDRDAFRSDLARLTEKATPVEMWLDDVEAPPADQVVSKHELESAQTATPPETEETP